MPTRRAATSGEHFAKNKRFTVRARVTRGAPAVIALTTVVASLINPARRFEHSVQNSSGVITSIRGGRTMDDARDSSFDQLERSVRRASLGIASTLTPPRTPMRHLAKLETAPLSEPTAPRSFGGLIGSSSVMQDVFALLERIAPKPLSLLVEGETGTGKEEVAQAVHAASPRHAAPFIVLDCATIPPNLAESVLFGHERGAFTSAEARYIGAFERAHRGTIFIDEIGELPPLLQPKLLRVLERRNLTRVGGREPAPIDVRVIAATHRDLRAEIEAGRFREDLYFRLAQVRVALPPLRARTTDIPELARLFAGHSGNGAPPEFEEGALEELSQRPFPGNVRELRNLVARAAALSESGVIKLEDLSSGGFGYRAASSELEDAGGVFAVAKQRAVNRFERSYLEALMKRAGGNISRAAREADLARHHLRELLRKHGLYAPPDSEAPPRQCSDQDVAVAATVERELDDAGRFRE